MGDEQINASDFKQRCLALFDRVAQSRATYLVTKHGSPVARVVPVDATTAAESTMGTVTILTDDEEELFSTGQRWEAAGD